MTLVPQSNGSNRNLIKKNFFFVPISFVKHFKFSFDVDIFPFYYQLKIHKLIPRMTLYIRQNRMFNYVVG